MPQYKLRVHQLMFHLLQLADSLPSKTIPARRNGKQTQTKTKQATKKHMESMATISSDATSSKRHCATVEDIEDDDVDIPGLTPLSCSSSMTSLVSTTSISSVASTNVTNAKVCL